MPPNTSRTSLAALAFIFAIPLLPVFSPRILSWAPLLVLIALFLDLGPEGARQIARTLTPTAVKLISIAGILLTFEVIRAPDQLLALSSVGGAAAVALFSLCLRALLLSLEKGVRQECRIAVISGWLLTVALLLLLLQGIVKISWIHAFGHIYPVVYNRAAVLVVLLTPAIMGMLITEVSGRLGKFCAVGAAGLAIAVSWTSVSETAKMCSLICPVIFLAYRANPRSMGRIISVAVAAMYLLWFPLTELALRGIASGYIPTSVGEFGSASTRLHYWHVAMTRVAERPILGFGPEAMTALKFAPEASRLPAGQMAHPHSAVAQTWLESGFFGVNCTLLLVAFTMHKIEARYSIERESLATTVVLFLAAWSISHGMWQAWFLGTAGFAISVCALCIQKRADEA
jgi:O-Antigen ligase